ncbi:MAG: arsenate reductase ArsC [Candidatus Bathyarchaeia archaeon]
MRVLFVCLGNSRRSQMAEAIFRHLSNDKAASAGLEPEKRVDENVITLLREIGIEIERPETKRLTEPMMEEADKIIAFKCLERIPAKYRHKAEDWDVGADSQSQLRDVYSMDYLRRVRNQIYEMVRRMVES